MEKIYRKIGKRYVECGYNIPDISDGIWLVQSNPNSKSQQSLVWKVGDLKRPVDVVTHAALQSVGDDLASYLTALTNENTPEFKEIKKMYGAWVTGAIGYYNISASDLVSLLLRRLAIHLEVGEYLSWDTLQYKFREDVGTDYIQLMNPIEALYAFTSWLYDNNIKFRQGKNIG
jgi:hypothetical protein